MIERRDALDAGERARRSGEATRRLVGLPEMGRAQVVAGFVAVRSEIDPAAALRWAEEHGSAIVFPRVTTQTPRLRFYRVAGPEDLVLGPKPFHLREPAAHCPEVSPEEIDVVVAPGLAFDAAGRRLGYGGGYYDEVVSFLRRGQAARGLVIGIGFDFQLVERCPVGHADVAIDLVVTDARVVRCELK